MWYTGTPTAAMYITVHLYKNNYADFVHRIGVIFTQTLCHQSQLSLADDACDSVLTCYKNMMVLR